MVKTLYCDLSTTENKVSSSVSLNSTIEPRKIPSTDDHSPYIRQLIDEYTWQHIRQLTDECMVAPPMNVKNSYPRLLPPRAPAP
jgi:hypothetical protein